MCLHFQNHFLSWKCALNKPVFRPQRQAVQGYQWKEGNHLWDCDSSWTAGRISVSYVDCLLERPLNRFGWLHTKYSPPLSWTSPPLIFPHECENNSQSARSTLKKQSCSKKRGKVHSVSEKRKCMQTNLSQFTLIVADFTFTDKQAQLLSMLSSSTFIVSFFCLFILKTVSVQKPALQHRKHPQCPHSRQSLA